MEQKELRVFFLTTEDSNEISTTIYNGEIMSWNKFNKLPDNAMAFIEKAEQVGYVYSIEGLQDALNSDHICMDDMYVFITDKY